MAPNEPILQQAIDEYLSSTNLSMRRVAHNYGIPESTLRRRIQDGRQSNKEAHERRRTLSDQQSTVVKEWMLRRDHWGFSIDHSFLRQIIFRITGHQPGKNWPSRWVDSQPDLVSVFHKPRDKQRRFQTTYHVFESFFNLLLEAKDKFNIHSDDIFNFDEKGIQLGVASASKIIRATANKKAGGSGHGM